MQHNEILANGYGKHYVVLSAHDIPTRQNLQAECFFHNASAQQFIHDLTAPPAYWQNLAQSCIAYSAWRNGNHWASVESFIASELSSGGLSAFEVSPFEPSSNTATRHTIKEQHGTQYTLLPAAAQLTQNLAELKQFTSAQSARAFLQSKSLNDKQLQSMIDSLKLSASDAGSTPIDTLSKALVQGNAIVSVQHPVAAPPKPLEEVAVEAVDNSPEASPEPAPAAKADEPVVSLDDAQAAALIAAAEEGSPVCEECQ